MPWQLEVRQRLRVGPPSVLRVMPRVLGWSHAGVAVDPRQIPTKPVRVEIPATGSARVGITWRGAPVRASWFARVEDTARIAASQRREMMRTPATGAHDLVWPLIALGLRLRVEAQIGHFALPVQEAPGPTQPGETTAFWLVLDDEHPAITARLLDAGQPAGHVPLWLTSVVGGKRQDQLGSTDAAGRVWVLLERRCAGQELQGLMCERMQDGNRIGVVAVAQTKRVVAPGLNDLGDLELAPMPLVVSGRVEDENGQAVPVSLQMRPSGAPAGSPPLQLSTVKGDDGAFTMRGHVEATDLVLQPSRGAAVPFQCGATGVRIVVPPRPGSIAAIVIHDLPYAHARLLKLWVRQAGAETQKTSGSFVPLTNQRCRLEVRGLDPGAYSAVLRLAGDPTPLATIAGIEVGSGRARDPRLHAIDVRGRVRLAQVSLVDAAGQRMLGKGRFELNAPQGENLWHLEADAGLLRVPLASGKVTGTLQIAGWRDCKIVDVDGDRTVTLEASFTARVRLTPVLVLPEGVTLHACARPKGQGVNPVLAMFVGQRGPLATADVRAAPLPGAQAFEFSLTKAGDYEVTFVLALRGETRSVALLATPSTITVTGIAGDELACAAEEGALQRALDALRQ